MENMILLDIETMDFDVDSGIYEVGLIVIQNGEVVLTEHIGEIEDETQIHLGMGNGYINISEDKTSKSKFKKIIEDYNYPIVGHNIPFDRKFMVHYGWLDEDYECYDSIRAIKYANPDLFSYSLAYLLSFYDIDQTQNHTALDDVKMLKNVIEKASPEVWIPLYKVSPSKLKQLIETTVNLEGESTAFEGKRIVFTGTSPFPRILMKEIAIKCGAIVTGDVSKKTDILVCGEGPGGKLEKARKNEVEIETDEWFIDAISKDIKLDTATVTNRRISSISDIQQVNEYYKIPELKGKAINIALLPIRTQKKVEDILTNEMEVGEINKGGNGYKVDYIIHRDQREYALLEKAEELQIKTIPLSKFNQMILGKHNKNSQYL